MRSCPAIRGCSKDDFPRRLLARGNCAISQLFNEFEANHLYGEPFGVFPFFFSEIQSIKTILSVNLQFAKINEHVSVMYKRQACMLFLSYNLMTKRLINY